MNNNRDIILSAMRRLENGTIGDISKVTDLSRGTITTYMCDIVSSPDSEFEVFNIGKKGVAIKFRRKNDTSSDTESIERYSDCKNDEGYTDSTAGEAMNNCICYEPDDLGKVYIFTNSVESTPNPDNMCVVLQKFSTQNALVIGLRSYEASNVDSQYVVPVDIDSGARLYADVRFIRSKPLRYLSSFVGNVTPRSKQQLRFAIAKMLGLNHAIEIEKVVEKPVEVIKEVVKEVPVEVIKEIPVEKIVEQPVTVPNNDLAVVDQARDKERADIYESVAIRLFDILEKAVDLTGVLGAANG